MWLLAGQVVAWGLTLSTELDYARPILKDLASKASDGEELVVALYEGACWRYSLVVS